MEFYLNNPSPIMRIHSQMRFIPGVQILCVGPEVCMRHGMMSYLNDLRGTLSFYKYQEIDVITGDYVTKIKDAAVELIRERHASCMIISTICQGAVLGTDEAGLKAMIKAETGVPVEYLVTNRLFLHSKQKGQLMNKKLEIALFSFLNSREKSPELSVNILDRVSGTKEGELHQYLRSAGVKQIRSLATSSSPEEYQEMAGAHLNIVTSKNMIHVAEMLEEKMGIPWVVLDAVYDPEKLLEQYKSLDQVLHGDLSIINESMGRLRSRLDEIRPKMENHTLIFDYMRVEYADEVERWLLKEGIAAELIRDFGPPPEKKTGGPPTHESEKRKRRTPGKGPGPSTGRPGLRPGGLAACFDILDKIEQLVEASE